MIQAAVPSFAGRVLGLAVALLAGCGGPPVGHPAVGLKVGSLPVVSLTTAGDRPPSLTGRVTLLNFWGTWCPPCRQELPGLARLAERLADEPRFQLVAISCGPGGTDDIDDLRAETVRFLASKKLSLAAWGDPDASARLLFQASFGLDAFPTTYLIDPDGRIRRVWVGFRGRDEADMAQAIVTLLKESVSRESVSRESVSRESASRAGPEPDAEAASGGRLSGSSGL